VAKPEDYSPIDRFKWELLDAGANRQDIGIAYGTVGNFLDNATKEEQYGLVQVALLELLDAGLIDVFVARFSDGFDIERADATTPTRDELIEWLASPEDPPGAPEDTLWWVDTDAGDDEWRRLRRADLV
jgi:hypothetical protein